MIKNVKNKELERNQLYEEIMRLDMEGISTILPLSEAPTDPEWLWPVEIEDIVRVEDLQEGAVPQEFSQGDIVLVNNFRDMETGKQFTKMTHRIFVVTDSGGNNVQKKIYYGYMLSSQAEKALLKNGYNNKNYHYIYSYNSILSTGEIDNDKPIVLRTDHPYEFTIKDVEGCGRVGIATEKFKDYVRYIMKNKNNPNTKDWETFEKEN